MDQRTMLFVLFLPLGFMSYLGDKASRQQTVNVHVRERYVTPICTNDTESLIAFIVCKIRPERSSKECHLSYDHGRGFDHGCDSRFRLMIENQTMFLHLSSLTSEDSGNYTCECSHKDGSNILRLNITVEDVKEENVVSSPGIPVLYVLIGAVIFIVVIFIILVFIYRKTHHSRRSHEPETTTVPPDTEPEDIEPYSIFLQRENGLYSLSKIRSVKKNVFYRDVHTETSV